jgi:hypothetical protein
LWSIDQSVVGIKMIQIVLWLILISYRLTPPYTAKL